MDYKNIISRKQFELGLSNRHAAKKISKKYKVKLNETTFGMIKLGYDNSIMLRTIVAQFFGIREEDLPKKWKDKTRLKNEPM